ncbi:MAG: hypothetical protein J5643_06710 [Lachnospiraceae bacterium]|nr:hypothetical protein [Lachnospiraceae bacterium]
MGKKVNGKKTEKQQNTAGAEAKKRDWTRILIWIAAAALIITIAVYFIVTRVFKDPNRTAANAAEATFRATYSSLNYEDFVKCTIYNEDCVKQLQLDVVLETNLIEQQFTVMATEEADGFKMKFEKAEVTEYDKDSDMYKKIVELIKEDHSECTFDEITKVAIAKIPYSVTYTADNSSEKGTERYVVLKVKGKWYCHPMMDAPAE